MFNGTDPMTGNPMLDPEGFLTAGSDAIDAGIDSGVPDDIEGELRPAGPAFDVGADEFGDIFLDGFESGNTAGWSATIP